MPLGFDPDLQEVQLPVGGIVELAVDHPGAGRHALYVARSHDGPVAHLDFHVPVGVGASIRNRGLRSSLSPPFLSPHCPR